MGSSSTLGSTPAEEDSILTFLTTDFLDSQTTNGFAFDSTFDSSLFFDPLQPNNNSLLHPLSPPNSVGTFSESSGSPHHSLLDEDLAADSIQPLDFWRQHSPDYGQQDAFSIMADTTLQQPLPNQPLPLISGTWPSSTSLCSAPISPAAIDIMNFPIIAENEPIQSRGQSNSQKQPPSPALSLKDESRSKRAKKSPAIAPRPVAPLLPLPSATPSPSIVQDAVPKQSPKLAIALKPPSSSTQAPIAMAPRRPSIVPAVNPSPVRSSTIIVKSSTIPDPKPPTEEAMTAQAKRQERLIKNRAAALLSRKRKREHMSLLENHTDQLKVDNQELQERVADLEEHVKELTTERDEARHECERLRHQITVLTHHHRPRSDSTLMDLDLEGNARTESDRSLNTKATGVVFMIILFSFALFTLPAGKLNSLMVGGRFDRSRIGPSILGRALDSYSVNQQATISGQVGPSKALMDLTNMTDLAVFSDNRALQTWLGHTPIVIPPKGSPARTASSLPTVVSLGRDPAAKEVESRESSIKSVGFVANSREPLQWSQADTASGVDDPERDALLYCTNLLYSLSQSNVAQAAGSARGAKGEVRRPKLSFISPLDGVVGSTASEKGTRLPPWMPNVQTTESDLEQRYLRLDVEVTSSRVVSGQGLGHHEQLIRFPIMPVGSVFDNSSSGWSPASSSSSSSSPSSSTRGGSSAPPSTTLANSGTVPRRRRLHSQQRMDRMRDFKAKSLPEGALLDRIKEETEDVYIKQEPVD